MKEAYSEALALRNIATELGVTFIVNDRCDLALAVAADGVHLGQTDLPLSYARTILGPDRLIGLSTHTIAQVEEANRLKPDYIGFGPIFTPGSKADHDPVVGLHGLRVARLHTGLPTFAIGGITAGHVGDVLQAGANGVAVVSAILKAPEIRRAVNDFVGRMPSPASSDA
jgi:thiamine-phosphate pyrophosphorylase